MNSRLIDINKYSKKNKELIMKINQSLQYGYSGEVWDGALVLSYYLLKNQLKEETKSKYSNKTILELGSGTGICGLITSVMSPKHIILTDLPDKIGILKENLEENMELIKEISPNTLIDIYGIDWRKEINDDLGKLDVDLIICCEIVYDEKLFDALIKTIIYFYKKDKTRIVFSYTFRKENEKTFFDMLYNQFLLVHQKKISFLYVNKDEYDQDFFDEEIKIFEVY